MAASASPAQRLLDAIDRCFGAAVLLLMAAMVMVGGLQVFNRFVLNQSISWSEEFQRFANIWMVFLAIPIAYRLGFHIAMTLFLSRFPGRVQRFLRLVVEICWLCLAVAIVWNTWNLMAVAKFQQSPGMNLRMDWVYSGILIGGLYLALVVIRGFIERIHRPAPGESPAKVAA
jgi:TRAP-type C4-dicarboxylate transport system permease small subunit